MSADQTAVRTRKITVEQVRTALERIAATYPNRRDRRAGVLPARYIDRGRPNCLAALALQRLGFSMGVLRALDREHPTGDIVHAGVRVNESRHPALRRVDQRALALLDYIQRRQDNGHTWGEVISEALTPTRLLPDRFARRRKPWLYVDASTTEEI